MRVPITTRNRSRDADRPSVCKYTHGWGGTDSASANCLAGRISESVGDVVTKDYAKRSAAGEIIMHDFVHKTYTQHFDDVDLKLRSNDLHNGHHYHFDYVGPTSYLLGMTSSLPKSTITGEEKAACADIAISQSHANVDVNEADMLSSVAEFSETTKFLAGSFKKVIKTLKVLKKFDLLYFKRNISLADLENAYLEARYALRPLCYEVAGIINAGGTKLTKTRQTARGSHVISKVHTDEKPDMILWYRPPGSGTWGIGRYTESQTTVESYGARAGVLFEVRPNELSFLSLWGLDQPLEAVWDLTPFSFIIDWFFNVSDIFGSMSHGISSKVLGSWVTTRYERKSVRTVKSLNITKGYIPELTNWNDINGKGSWETEITKTRIISPKKPNQVHLNVKLDAPKLLDLSIIGKNLAKSLVHL